MKYKEISSKLWRISITDEKDDVKARREQHKSNSCYFEQLTGKQHSTKPWLNCHLPPIS